jgi:hypothetical protein
MIRPILAACLFIAAGLSACGSPSVTTATRPMAIQTAQTRARHDLQCPKAKANVVSSQAIAPASAPGPLGAGDSIKRAQFGVGIAGCDQPRTMTVMCSQERGCFAGPAQPAGAAPGAVS